MLSPYRIIFHTSYLWKFPPELWRLFTSFFLSGPQLGILFDPYFIWQYGSALETGSASFTTPGTFFVFVVFVGLFILVCCYPGSLSTSPFATSIAPNRLLLPPITGQRCNAALYCLVRVHAQVDHKISLLLFYSSKLLVVYLKPVCCNLVISARPANN